MNKQVTIDIIFVAQIKSNPNPCSRVIEKPKISKLKNISTLTFVKLYVGIVFLVVFFSVQMHIQILMIYYRNVFNTLSFL